MTKYYTGVGSRSTPQDIMVLMTQVATKLEALGYSLRSGAADGHRLVIDHIQPLSKGGTNDIDNLTSSCEDCNIGKGTQQI